MDEVMNYSSIDTVEELTNVINNELHKAAISFVRVGYLLKRARDEDILKDTGFSDIYEYANTKFGLDKSQVSRFMRINDRYSIGGYSEHLKEEYESFGYSKLALMLTLPDEINEQLSPDMSKTEINTIKTEYEAEQQISDLEVLMEDTSDVPDEFITAVVKELNDEHPESAKYLHDTMQIAEKMGIEVNDADIREAYIPEGSATYIIRIAGQGRFMVKMEENDIMIISVRNPDEKSPLTWAEFMNVLMKDMKVRTFPEEKKDKQEEPAQKKKPEKRKAEKVKPAKVKKEEPEKPEVAPVQEETVLDQSENKQEPAAGNEEGAPEENDQAAGDKDVTQADIEKVEGEIVSEPDESALIHKLRDLMYTDNRKEYVCEFVDFGNYREQLDQIAEWNAEINNVIKKLYTALHDRGV